MPASTSPTSSRKTVPTALHCSSQPARSCTAPVNAPRRWPKSSDSMSVGASAERFKGWKTAAKSSAKRPLAGSYGT